MDGSLRVNNPDYLCLCPNSKLHHSKFQVKLMFAGETGGGDWVIAFLYFSQSLLEFNKMVF